MATLALTVAGGLVGGPIGAAAGAAIGSAIDQHIIAPKLFPTDDEEPTSEDLNRFIETGVEGVAQEYPIGKVRVPGFVIWKGALIPTGNGAAPAWAVPVAVAPCSRRRIVRFVKLWANSHLLYNDDHKAEISSDQIEAFYTFFNGITSINYRNHAATPSFAGPPPFFPSYAHPVIISGFTNPKYNGTKLIYDIFIPPAPEDPYPMMVASGNAYLEASEGPGPTIDMFQNLSVDPTLTTGFAFYHGEQKTADSAIAAASGLGADTPAFYGTPYIRIAALDLSRNFGNRMPTFEMLVETEALPFTLEECITLLVKRAGLSASDIDASTLTENFHGIRIDGPKDTRSILDNIMVAYNVVQQDVGGVVRFFKRDAPDTIVIADGDLAAGDGNPPKPTATSPQDPLERPREVTVRFQNVDQAYQQGQQTERRRVTGRSRKIEGLNLPIALTRAQARAIARRKLWSDWCPRKQLQVPASYLEILEGDLVQFVEDGDTIKAIVNTATIGEGGVVELDTIQEFLSSTTQDETDDENDDEPDIETPQVRFEVLDIPAVFEQHVGQYGAYWVSGYSGEKTSEFIGTTLLRSSDDFLYDALDNNVYEAFVGEVVKDFAPNHWPDAWDESATLTVRMTTRPNGRNLTNATEQEVYNGKNMIMVGKVPNHEILSFRNVTESPAGVFALTGLLRGQRDSKMLARVIDGDTAAHPVVVLDREALRFVNFQQDDYGVPYFFKCLPPGALVENTDINQVYTYAAKNIVPFRVVNLRVILEASGTRNVLWYARTTGFHSLFGEEESHPDVFDDQPEEYEVEICTLDNYAGLPLATRAVQFGSGDDTTIRFYEMTVTERVDLGFSASDTVVFRVYHISNALGVRSLAAVVASPGT